MTQPNFKRSLTLIPILIVGFPLLQSFIIFAGACFNTDLLNQFSYDGSNRDSWFDLIFALVIFGVRQSFIALLLGTAMVFALTLPPRFRCPTLLGMSVLGVLVCGWLLWGNWNFTANNCGADGCAAESSIAFDFLMVVFYGLPLAWNMGACFYAALVLGSAKKDVQGPRQ